MNAPRAAAPVVLLPVPLDELVDRVVERLAENRVEPEGERLLDREELAQRLGISTRSLDTLRAKPNFPELHVLEAPRFRWAAVVAWLEDNHK